jgi:hypothetical protein
MKIAQEKVLDKMSKQKYYAKCLEFFKIENWQIKYVLDIY